MHAKIQSNARLSPLELEKRSAVRAIMGLPMLIVFHGKRHGTLLCNLSPEGAKIETSAPLMIKDKVEFLCGSICADGVVLWCRSTTFGIKFARQIDGKQLVEQVLRSEAIARWRKASSATRSVRSPESLPQGLSSR